MTAYQESHCWREYGVPPTVEGVRLLARSISSCSLTARRYVAIVRHNIRKRDPEELNLDYRLLVVGFNRLSPQKMAEVWPSWEAWWYSTQLRPAVVGSSYNMDPGKAWVLFRKGIKPRGQGGEHLVGGEPGHHYMKLSRRKSLRAARALRRASLGSTDGKYSGLSWSARALAALGALCPELQRVAVDSAPTDLPKRENGYPRLYRTTDVDWAVVAQHQEMLVRDQSGRVRAAMAGNRRCLSLLGVNTDREAAALLSPQYPQIPFDMARKVALGHSPVELSKGQLTKKEAHQWLRDDPYNTPIRWLVERLRKVSGSNLPEVRSLAVVRWLENVHRSGRWDALTRERSLPGPGGAIRTVRFIEKIDEIQDIDLVNGPKTSVRKAFEAAAERFGEEWLANHSGDHRVLGELPLTWGQPYKSITPLFTPAALIAEGKEMEHCVGSYVHAVQEGQSIILSLRILDRRSTAEVTPDGEVLQHRGRMNEFPDRSLEALLESYLRRRVR